ncbi:MAG: GntR family transcriptional regulator [Pseudomonadota bacterium]|nr:GntR family transcriptional regulator [Pseudomonadota bacterium]
MAIVLATANNCKNFLIMHLPVLHWSTTKAPLCRRSKLRLTGLIYPVYQRTSNSIAGRVQAWRIEFFREQTGKKEVLVLKRGLLNRQENGPCQIYEVIPARILSTELPPGSSIHERYLADTAGLSRTPTHEAVRNISNDGPISILPNADSSVAQCEPSRVLDFCQIRTAFEHIAIRTAVKNFDAVHERQLVGLINDQEKTIDRGDMVSNIAIDSEFHSVIMELGGYKVMPDFLHTAMGEILRARYMSIKLPGRLRESIVEHQVIVEALRSGNPNDCAKSMKFHLDKSFISIMQVLESVNVK